MSKPSLNPPSLPPNPSGSKIFWEKSPDLLTVPSTSLHPCSPRPVDKRPLPPFDASELPAELSSEFGERREDYIKHYHSISAVTKPAWVQKAGFAELLSVLRYLGGTSKH